MLAALASLLFASCTTSPTPKPIATGHPAAPADSTGGKQPNWEEVDKTSARVRERESKKDEDRKASESVTTDGNSTTYEKKWSW